MTLSDLQQELLKIKNLGYVKSQRTGSTGIGYTFESLLGIHENNLPIPDIGGRVEIKTIRRDSKSLITLFTFNRSVWQLSQKDLIKKYGYIDQKGRKALKNTVFSQKSISQGIYLNIDKEKNLINLVDENNDEILATWDIYVIVGKFMSKLSRLLLVIADRKKINGIEYFHYNEAYLLSEPSARKFLAAFESGIIGVDIRLHLKDSGSVRNRGTGFRIKEIDLIKLYEKNRRLI